MSSYTPEQLAALRASIAQGALEVRYADKTVKYRSLAEMQAIERAMVAAIYPATNKPRRRLAQHDKGL